MTEPTSVTGQHRPGLLTALRGLPGSGKTTLAEQMAAADPNVVTAGRDPIRRELAAAGCFVGRIWDFRKGDEALVTVEQQVRILRHLVAGRHVIVDDLNLRPAYLARLQSLAVVAGAGWEVVDVDTPIDECVRRDALRTGDARLGEDRIRAIAAEAGWGVHLSTLPTPDARTRAVIVDIDGTLAVRVPGPDGTIRSPYPDGEHRVGEDAPVHAVITAVRAMRDAGHDVVVTSGRTRGCEQATRRWLAEHLGGPYTLHMRAVGDERHDDTVKREIYIREIHPWHEVVCVFDDRDQVVQAWRAMGLPVFQVAEGNF